MLVHNILPLRGRLAGFGLEAGTCGHCGGLEDMQHFFQRCPLVSDSWERLYFKLVGLLPGLPSDFELIMLAFPVARWPWKGWWWPTWESSWPSGGSLVACSAPLPGATSLLPLEHTFWP
jgi:hypothetical protein